MKTKKIISVVLVILVLLFAAGCGEKSAGNSPGDVMQLSFATAGTSGSFYPLGGGIAKVINDNYSQYNVSAEATAGSVENVRLFDSHSADMAFISADTAFEGYKGEGADFTKPANILALMTTYNQPTHIIAIEGSGIKSIGDLKGKKVAVGAPASGTEHKTKLILEALGLTYDDIDEKFLSFAESVTAFQDHQIDAAIMGVGAPASAVMDLGSSMDFDMISMTDEEINTVIAKYPYFQKAVMPAGTYEEINYDVSTIGAAILICVRADLDEQVAYDLTAVLLEHNEEIKAIHALGAEINTDNALPTVIPLHPGAEKYYKEKGITD
ncbi:MAG: TAXI family TRAP transporter solute-binding subunit [Dehalobacterium sp.]